jgi:tetratricopeptide (TPR) repeat protein
MAKKKRVERSVFLSYRRTNVGWATAIWQNLTQHGFDVFLDFEGLGSGDFSQQILDNIRARAHFVVLLTPSALERCKNPGDWLRREIETALDSRRNVVPLTLEGFDFGDPGVARQLTGKLESLKHYNALSLPVGHFQEVMKKLRERYLNLPLGAVLHPASSSTLQLSANQQAAALNAPLVPEADLAAEEWFERGYSSSNEDEKIRCFDQAIMLKPDYGAAYVFRGLAHSRGGNEKAAMDDLLKGASLAPRDAWGHYGLAICLAGLHRYEDAIAQLDEAILLDPSIPELYLGRAQWRRELGDLAGADDDYSELLRLVPDDEDASEVYCERGNIRSAKGDFAAAVKDFTEAIRLSPNNELAYGLRGRARARHGDTDDAISDFDKLIDLLPNLGEAYVERGDARFSKADLDGAISDYDEAIRLKPELAAAYFNRGLVMEYQEKYDGAIADFERYLALSSGIEHSKVREVKRRIKAIEQKAGKGFWSRLW